MRHNENKLKLYVKLTNSIFVIALFIIQFCTANRLKRISLSIIPKMECLYFNMERPNFNCHIMHNVNNIKKLTMGHLPHASRVHPTTTRLAASHSSLFLKRTCFRGQITNRLTLSKLFLSERL